MRLSLVGSAFLMLSIVGPLHAQPSNADYLATIRRAAVLPHSGMLPEARRLPHSDVPVASSYSADEGHCWPLTASLLGTLVGRRGQSPEPRRGRRRRGIEAGARPGSHWMKPCGPIAAAFARRCLSHQRPLHCIAERLFIDRDTKDHSLRHCPAPRLHPPLQRPQ